MTSKAGMAHSDCGWTCGCAGKLMRSLEIPYLSFYGGDSLRRGAISSVCTITFNLMPFIWWYIVLILLKHTTLLKTKPSPEIDPVLKLTHLLKVTILPKCVLLLTVCWSFFDFNSAKIVKIGQIQKPKTLQKISCSFFGTWCRYTNIHKRILLLYAALAFVVVRHRRNASYSLDLNEWHRSILALLSGMQEEMAPWAILHLWCTVHGSLKKINVPVTVLRWPCFRIYISLESQPFHLEMTE